MTAPDSNGPFVITATNSHWPPHSEPFDVATLVEWWRRYEAAAERDKLILLCHPDDHDGLKAALDDVLARMWVTRRVELVVNEHMQPGQVLSIDNRYLQPDLPAVRS